MSSDGDRWWRNAAIYQIYPRSFQDSDGDGIGDLPGIVSRLDHLVDLGVDGLWLSPIYPSPLADFGYDISDYTAVDPVFGTLEDFDRLVEEAAARGLRVLMDLVPCHTSVEHPWFRDHPDRYVWASGRDGGPPNNWQSAFGGPAWSRDPAGGDRWYLHSFYPEQADLDWRDPEVVEAFGEVVRFWLDRGVAGFRVDAIDRLLKDPELRDDDPAAVAALEFGHDLSPGDATPVPPPAGPGGASPPIPSPAGQAPAGGPGGASPPRISSRNAPDIPEALAKLRAAAGDALLVGEVFLPAPQVAPYLGSLDATFAFDLFHAPWEAGALQAAVEAQLELPGTPACTLSNHDFPRLPDRYGEEAVADAARLICSLPGLVFIYQGDEIGMRDGPGHDPPFDRAGRDAHRHPMQWDGSPNGGFTTGTPWLALVDPAERNVADQRADPDSLLNLYRDLLAWRRQMTGEAAGGTPPADP